MALKGTRVLGVVEPDELELTITRQVRPQQESETVLECLKFRGALFLHRDVCAVTHFFSAGDPFHPY